MLTRSQVAERLGRSVATVRRLEGRVLHPTPDGRGVNRFDHEEVDALARRVIEEGVIPVDRTDKEDDAQDQWTVAESSARRRAEQLATEVQLREEFQEVDSAARRKVARLQGAVAEGLLIIARLHPTAAMDVEKLLRRLSAL